MSSGPHAGRFSRRGPAAWIPVLAVLALFWALVLWQQRLEWTVNPVYSYGFAMPFLVGYLLWAGWLSRPASGPHLSKKIFWSALIVVLVALLPARVVQEANPDWVRINWLINGLWVSATWLMLARAGGVRYALHFAFPLLFSFAALPWPVWLEEALMQSFMRTNALICADVLTLLGTPAMAVGNLIQVSEHWVNVEEACSGITSLQTAFMMSLFLGEFFRFGIGRRLVLAAGSFAVAMAVNLGRTVTLAYLAKSGSADRWHDTVGNVSMVFCLALIGGVAWWLGRKKGVAAPLVEQPARPLPTERRPFGVGAAVAIAGWLLLTEAGNEAWYRAHERSLPPPHPWAVSLPRELPDFVQGEFGERALALLKFNSGVTASWRSEFGHQWQMYCLEWAPGRVSRFLSSSHYPTVCLPASGLKLVTETGKWTYRSGDLEIPFTTYLFDEHGKEVYVFHCVLEDRPRTEGARLSYRQVAANERLASVWRGERNLGQRVIGLALRGPYSPSEAQLAVEAGLGRVISLKRGGGEP